MRSFDLIAVLLVAAGLFSYINHRFLKLPATIGLMIMALATSLILVLVGQIVPGLQTQAHAIIERADFSDTVLHGMLGFLLFAGALHVKLDDLAIWRTPIAILATVGVLISTALVGGLTWLVFQAFGLEARLVYCLLFGALISPTDPIAVLGLLKQFGTPKSLEIKIAGESLFNDGIAVVVFFVLLNVATSGEGVTAGHIAELFVQETIGGTVMGLAAGYLAYRLFKSVDNYQVEVLLSLALAAGVYAGAEHLHMSAPIAVVVAGLLVGNQGRGRAMSSLTVDRLDGFWELIDEILNAILFVFLGFEVLVLTFTGQLLAAGVVLIGVVLVSRLIAVGLPVLLLRRWGWVFEPYTIPILTWGSLRGAISVALTLSLPRLVDGVVVPEREMILAVTYVVVTFSILGQGLTVGRLVQWLLPPEPTSPKT